MQYVSLSPIQKVLTPSLKILRSAPDNLEEYVLEYGYMGQILYSNVVKARQAAAAAAASQPRPTLTIQQVTHTLP